MPRKVIKQDMQGNVTVTYVYSEKEHEDNLKKVDDAARRILRLLEYTSAENTNGLGDK